MDIKFKTKDGTIVNIDLERFRYKKASDDKATTIMIKDITKAVVDKYSVLTVFSGDSVMFESEINFKDIGKATSFTLMIKRGPDHLMYKQNKEKEFDVVSLYKTKKDVLNRFSEVGVTDTFGTAKEIDELPKLLHKEEIILYATSGLLDGNTWLIVCTDKRLLFLDKGMIFGIKTLEFRLDKINSVSAYKGMVFGELKISHGSATMTVKNIGKDTVQKMVDVIHKAIDDYENSTTPAQNQQPTQLDPYEEVKKLKELLDMGIISSEDFDLKKNELLGL